MANLVAESEQMQRVLDLCRRASEVDVPLLIEGETGTGKEELARLVHDQSGRKDGPFTVLNCAALPESLLESELFGHVEGAFTGAEQDKPGLFRSAGGGTLFLDEIGDMPTSLQPRLLRVLESRRVRPVGSSEQIPVDVRLVAATNRNLLEEVERNNFRRDLYHRLKVIGIEVPPLRERPDDILPLARRFLREACGKFCEAPDCATDPELPAEIRSVLTDYDWPGNVRELKNAMIRAAALVGSPDLEVQSLPREIFQKSESSKARSDFAPRPLEDVEREHIHRTLEYYSGSRKKAAESLGISETTLWRRLKGYDGLRSK